jgi:C4-type Zn-finger protein
MTLSIKEPNRWWMNKEVQCPCCEAVFKLTDSSTVVANPSKIDGTFAVSYQCHHCTYGILIKK